MYLGVNNETDKSRSNYNNMANKRIWTCKPLGGEDPITLGRVIIVQTKKEVSNDLFFCDPLGVRTQYPNIKSVVLYRLS